MRAKNKESTSSAAPLANWLIAGALIVQATVVMPVFATATFDDGSVEEPRERQSLPDPVEDGAPDTIPPTSTNTRATSTTSTDTDSSPTYSIRLPQAVTGSVVPVIPTGKPQTSPGNPYMPRSAAPDPDHPLAWRATAEAIRQQQPNQSLVVSTFKSDFKTTYNNLLSEFETDGWILSSVSLPAGHFLIRIPRPPSTTRGAHSQEDAAAWLILAITPVDSGNTEVRIKIQSRHPGQFLSQLSATVQRCQLKSNGNQLF